MARVKRTPDTNAAEFEAVAKALEFSLLLLDSDTNIKFASAQAHKVFGSKDADELKSQWRDYFDRLKLPDLVQLEKNSKPFHHRIELQNEKDTHLLRMEIYPLRHDKCDCYVMYVKDREVLGGVEQELVLASYHYIQRYLISTLVHDLNAPINTMRITLELIERMLSTAALGASNEFATKWERYRNILREELGKLKTQVADIPNLFDASGGAVSAAFDVRSVVDYVARFLKHEATSKNVRREIDLPDTAIVIYGRQSELQLALLNLASGLVEATVHGGRLRLSMTTNDGLLEIVLHGSAVDVNQLSSFDGEQLRFSPNGSNLGMFVAQLIIEAHGGEVRVTSSVDNEWVMIQVTLPNRSPKAINPSLN